LLKPLYVSAVQLENTPPDFYHPYFAPFNIFSRTAPLTERERERERETASKILMGWW
jgi:hypothetical protein